MKNRLSVVALCALTPCTLADAFVVRGVSINFQTDNAFVQQTGDLGGASVPINALLAAGVVWTDGLTNILAANLSLDDDLRLTTFIGGDGGVGTPNLSDPPDTGLINGELPLPGDDTPITPPGVNPPTLLISPLDGSGAGLDASGTDDLMRIEWVVTQDIFTSAPGVLNGVAGDYYWLGQFVVPEGDAIDIPIQLDALVNTVSMNQPVPGDEFLTAPDGSLYASFDSGGDTFHWTLLKERTEAGLDVYQLYLSDVQVVPASGAIALAPFALVALRRRR